MLNRVIILLFLFTLSSSMTQYQLIKFELFKYIKDFLMSSLGEAAITKKFGLDCLAFLQSAFEYDEDLYLLKLISDSGKNTNDLGSYLDCMSIDYNSYTKSTKEIKDNLTYLIVHVLPHLSEEKTEYIIGICAPNKDNACTVQDYKLLISKAFELAETKIKVGFDDIHIYNMQKDSQDLGYVLFLKFIPLIIIFSMILIGLIWFLPKLMCYPCYRNKSKEEKQKILSCFSLRQNSYEILSDNKRGNNIITNENGLSIIRGLRGLAMIFFIIGHTFKHLYHSPVKIYVPELLQAFISSFSFILILFGLRYAKAIILALSSFTLIYKIVNYLDDDRENNNSKDISLTDSDFDDSEFSINLEGEINSKKEEEKETDEDQTGQFNFLDLYQKNRKNLMVSSLLFFILRQTYKYLIFTLSLLIFKYSLYESFSYLSSPTPVWVYLKEAIIDSFDPLRHFMSNLLLYSAFSHQTFFGFDLFMMAYNEIFFFIVFSIIIFIGYKWNKRLDLLFIALFILCAILKACLVILLPPKNGEHFYPSKVYQKTYYSFILSNPVYNMPSALIGLFFGLVYFSVQNSIKATNIRRFLFFPNAISNALSANKILKIVLLIVSSILFLLCVLGFICAYPFYSNGNVAFFENTVVNIVALYDVDIGLIAFFVFIICLFLLGNNFFITFLTHDYWNFIARPFFLFLVDINIISYYIFYQSESTVKLELFNVLFYSLLILIIMLVVNSFLFLFFEIPLKKLNKLIIKAYQVKKTKKKSRTDTNTNTNTKIMPINNTSICSKQ